VHFVWYAAEFVPPELACSSYYARKAKYYDGTDWPVAFFDGALAEPILEVDSFFSKYVGYVAAARATAALVTITIDSTEIVGDTALSVALHVAATDTLINDREGLQLTAVVVEDSAPYYSFLNQDTVYVRACVRRVIGGDWGVPVDLEFGDELDTILTTRLGDWKPEHLGVVVFLQDTSSLEVLQSAGRKRIQ
jgi:hypothetical protein